MMPIYGKKVTRLTAEGLSDVSKRLVFETVETRIKGKKSVEAIVKESHEL